MSGTKDTYIKIWCKAEINVNLENQKQEMTEQFG